MPNYIVEALLVAIYTATLYTFITTIFPKLSFPIVLAICGFCKHFFASYLGLWYLYCNFGQACMQVAKQRSSNQPFTSNNNNIIRDSVVEAFAFVALGLILYRFIENKLYIIAIIGFTLHILSEWLSIHTNFCITNCELIKNE